MNEHGYVYNATQALDGPRRQDIGARATLAYNGGRFRAVLKGEYSKFDTVGRDIEVIRDIATGTISSGPLAGQPLTYANSLTLRGLPGVLNDTDFNYRRQSDFGEFDHSRLYNTTFTADLDVGASTLTAVTGYVDYTRHLTADLDFTAANILEGQSDEHYRQFSQELRLVTPASAPISFVGGLYYEHNTFIYSDITGFGPNIVQAVQSPAPPSLAPLAALSNVGVVRDFTQTNNSYAAFGQLTWRVTDRLRLIGGGRVTLDDKDGTRVLVARAGELNYDGAVITSPVVIAVLQSGLRFSLNNPGGAGHNLAASRKKTRFVPSATIEYDLTPAVLLFGSYKEGYKGGGFNARSNNNTNFAFDDELVTQWEGGFRARFAQNRGSVGVTAYHAIYSTLQISQFDGTVGFNVGNAGRTRVQGVEADARFAVARGITIGGSASYLDFKYLDFRRGNCAFGQTPNGDVVNGVQLCDYTGLRGRFTPKWNLTGSVGLDRPLSGAISLRGSLDVSYKSAHNVHDNLDPLGYIDGYTIVDARLGVGGKNWDVAVIGRNLLDENFPTFTGNVPFASFIGANTQYATTSRPRSVAAQLSVRY
jgi:outer membrane receptor protein involved in Fe transport